MQHCIIIMLRLRLLQGKDDKSVVIGQMTFLESHEGYLYTSGIYNCVLYFTRLHKIMYFFKTTYIQNDHVTCR